MRKNPTNPSQKPINNSNASKNMSGFQLTDGKQSCGVTLRTKATERHSRGLYLKRWRLRTRQSTVQQTNRGMAGWRVYTSTDVQLQQIMGRSRARNTIHRVMYTMVQKRQWCDQLHPYCFSAMGRAIPVLFCTMPIYLPISLQF